MNKDVRRGWIIAAGIGLLIVVLVWAFITWWQGNEPVSEPAPGMRAVTIMVPDRADWDAAFARCQATGKWSDIACAEALSDGEF